MRTRGAWRTRARVVATKCVCSLEQTSAPLLIAIRSESTLEQHLSQPHHFLALKNANKMLLEGGDSEAARLQDNFDAIAKVALELELGGHHAPTFPPIVICILLFVVSVGHSDCIVVGRIERAHPDSDKRLLRRLLCISQHGVN